MNKESKLVRGKKITSLSYKDVGIIGYDYLLFNQKKAFDKAFQEDLDFRLVKLELNDLKKNVETRHKLNRFILVVTVSNATNVFKILKKEKNQIDGEYIDMINSDLGYSETEDAINNLLKIKIIDNTAIPGYLRNFGIDHDRFAEEIEKITEQNEEGHRNPLDASDSFRDVIGFRYRGKKNGDTKPQEDKIQDASSYSKSRSKIFSEIDSYILRLKKEKQLTEKTGEFYGIIDEDEEGKQLSSERILFHIENQTDLGFKLAVDYLEDLIRSKKAKQDFEKYKNISL